jgi:hypothetical protein
MNGDDQLSTPSFAIDVATASSTAGDGKQTNNG